MKKFKELLFAATAVCLIVAVAFIFCRFNPIAGEEIEETVKAESAAIQLRLDDRAAAIERKLERVEGKLDRILELISAPPSDNVKIIR